MLRIFPQFLPRLTFRSPGDRQVMHGLMQVFYNKQTHFQIGDNTNLFDWTYVTNVAKAHLLAADRLSKPREDLEELKTQPLQTIDLSTGVRRVPTSTARPIGPAVEPPINAGELEASFREEISYEPRPVVRTRFDQLNEAHIEQVESDPYRVDGQVFFITNGEPTYFWDFMRAVWHEMGDPLDRKIFRIPKSLGSVLATLAEGWSWLLGKEPTFTRFRVTFSCATRWHNIEKARLVLGYEPDVGVVEGVKKMCDVSLSNVCLVAFANSCGYPTANSGIRRNSLRNNDLILIVDFILATLYIYIGLSYSWIWIVWNSRLQSLQFLGEKTPQEKKKILSMRI